MRKIMLCGRPSCGSCPSIEVDAKNNVLHIVDGEQRIILSKEHQEQLCKYLCKKGCCEK